MFTAYYDLAVSPPTYDIVAFLCAVEAKRIELNEDRISIEILPGPNKGFRQDNFWPFNIEGRWQMLEKVAIPMAKMLPNANVILHKERPSSPKRNSIGWGYRLFGLAIQVEAMRKGIRPLKPPTVDAFNPHLVTITLREAEHWPLRNSNVPEWLAAAKELRIQGWQVVVVRDTLKFDEPLEDLDISPDASSNLIDRARLYQKSICNLFVNNGPAWFALALGVPVLIYRPVIEGVQYGCSKDYFSKCELPFGSQISNEPLNQRLVWVDDEAQNILDGFSGFINNSVNHQ